MRLKASDMDARTRVGRAQIAVLATIATCAMGALAAAPASAVVAQTPSGKQFGYMPLNGQERPTTPSGTDAIANLEYHGGPVMPAMHEHAIFWAPTGFSYPSGYEAAVVKYLQDLAADSGRPTNTTSVGSQYADSSTAQARYSVTFADSFDDANAYPTSGCSLYTPLAGAAFTKCLTDTQLRAEVDAFITSHSLPRGLSDIYFLVLPDSVGSCVGTSCFDREFCAYHSDTSASGTETIYANESFTPRDPAHCGSGNYPNGTSNGPVDDQLSSLSHESNEAREDPLLTGWWNTDNSNEGADQCRNTADDYGPLLGGTAGIDGFNQTINGSHYILQRDWSNAVSACEQRYGLTGTASGPSLGTPGQSLSFTASGTDTEGGSIASIVWHFGDGGTKSAGTTTHAYSAPGTYHPFAVVTNSTGLSVQAAAPTVTIKKPPNSFKIGDPDLNKSKGTAKLRVTIPGPGKLALAGTGVKADSADSSHAGTTKLVVKAKGKAKHRLKKHGRVSVKVKVTFTPTGGDPRKKSEKVKLVRK